MMRGSFDDPPIVVSWSRWLPGLMLPIPLFFAVGGAWLIASFGVNFGAAFLTGTCWLMTLFLVWRLVFPPRLEISSEGLLWFDGRKALNFKWNDFDSFRAYVPNRGFFKFVGYNYSPDSPKRHQRLAPILVSAAGFDGSFGGPWEISADKIVALLAEAKAKWS